MNVVLCSHLLRDVEEVCDEAVILKNGQIVHHADLEAERRSNRRFVELEVAGDDLPLGPALEGIGVEAVREGDGRWRMVLPPETGIDALWRLVAALHLRVHKLTHRRDTLEEIFLKAVGHLPPGEAAPAAAEEVAADGRL